MTQPDIPAELVAARAPARIQMRRTKGWRKPDGAVYVGRPSVFGNPFVCSWPCGCPKSAVYDHGYDDDGAPSMHCCTDTFRRWVQQGIADVESHLIGFGGGIKACLMAMGGNRERTKLVDGLPRLRGHSLGCWCPSDRPCHADVLIELASLDRRAGGGADNG